MGILKRLPGSVFSVVERNWEGDTVVLIGGGHSLTLAQVLPVAIAHSAGRLRCIAVNDAFLWAPWADVCYGADQKWHRWMAAGLDKPALGLRAQQVADMWHSFEGEKCSIETDNDWGPDGPHVLRNVHHPYRGTGLSTDPTMLVTGRNSGFQALNLAVLAGAKTVILLGYDARHNPMGESHFHGEHPSPPDRSSYPYFIRAMSDAEAPLKAAGVRVINCTPGSAINSFEFMNISEALR